MIQPLDENQGPSHLHGHNLGLCVKWPLGDIIHIIVSTNSILFLTNLSSMIDAKQANPLKHTTFSSTLKIVDFSEAPTM